MSDTGIAGLTPEQQAKLGELRRWLAELERAMTDERVPRNIRHRVRMRLLYGDPEGPEAIHRVSAADEVIELPVLDEVFFQGITMTAIHARRVLDALRTPRPDLSGFAGPKECHATPGGVRIHVKPWCRCPRKGRA